MRSYTVDIDPGQLVRWLVADCETAPARFRTQAWRGAAVREIPADKEFRVGDEEREDFQEVETVATLDVAPEHASDGWVLTVVVEDEAGPRLPDEGPLAAGEERIGVNTFYDEFILPGRGIANVEVEAEDEAAEARVEQFIRSVEGNRH